MVLLSHSAKVEDGIAHTAQTGIDAHIGGLGDFLERHVLVISHVNHFTLVGRQEHHELLHVAHNLLTHQLALHVAIHHAVSLKPRQVVVVLLVNDALMLLVTVSIYDDVVRNAHEPCTKLTIR